MTIGKKVSLACGALVALTVVLGSVAALNINRMNSRLHSILGGPVPGLYSVGLLQAYSKEQKIAMLEHIVSENADQKKQKEAVIANLESSLNGQSMQIPDLCRILGSL